MMGEVEDEGVEGLRQDLEPGPLGRATPVHSGDTWQGLAPTRANNRILLMSLL